MYSQKPRSLIFGAFLFYFNPLYFRRGLSAILLNVIGKQDPLIPFYIVLQQVEFGFTVYY